MDLTVVAYATLALSLFVSAVKMGGWILNADPRAIINSGRWALVALAALALGVLAWLVASGRWTSAMMLAAFMLPVFVQAAPRWRVLFGPINAAKSDFPPNPRDRQRSRRLPGRARDDGSGAGAAGDRRVERVSRASGSAARASGRRATPRER